MHLVLSLCVDDGAVIYMNGKELGRVNMPLGPVSAETFASQAIGDSSEGFYVRLRVPSAELRAGQKNGLAVEVHQAAVTSSDLFFDLVPEGLPRPRAHARRPGRCAARHTDLQ